MMAVNETVNDDVVKTVLLEFLNLAVPARAKQVSGPRSRVRFSLLLPRHTVLSECHLRTSRGPAARPL